MRVLLVAPTIGQNGWAPSTGLGYISSYLKKHGHQTRIVEIGANKERTFHEIAEEFNPDIVGIAVWCNCYKHSLKCAEYIKKRFPNAIRVAGGPLATFIIDEILNSGCFEYVIAGPGELAFASLLKEIEANTPKPGLNISGVYYRGHNKPMQLGDQIMNLDELPFPDRDPDGQFIFPFSIMMNRGCNQKCMFCVNPQMAGVRCRSVSNVISEIKYVMNKYNSQTIIFNDDNIAIKRSQLLELCKELSKIEHPSWIAQIRGDIELNLLDIMKDAGCVRLGIGVESGNEDVLKGIKKGVSLSRINKTVSYVSSIGIKVTLYYMLGHHCDTPETMQDTIEHAKYMTNTYGAMVRMSCNTVFPGSPQHMEKDKLGIKIYARNWDEYKTNNPTISAKAFTIDDLREKYFLASELMHDWWAKQEFVSGKMSFMYS